MLATLPLSSALTAPSVPATILPGLVLLQPRRFLSVTQRGVLVKPDELSVEFLCFVFLCSISKKPPVKLAMTVYD